VLVPEEARTLIDAIEIATPAGLRDRALIGLMVFSFARIGAALGMKVEDVFTQNRQLWVRLRREGRQDARHARATTALRLTLPPILRAQASPTIPRGRCDAFPRHADFHHLA
jgi:integrase